jgi:hypothetical protein
VHALDHVELGEPLVVDLERLEFLGDDADDVAASR